MAFQLEFHQSHTVVKLLHLQVVEFECKPFLLIEFRHLDLHHVHLLPQDCVFVLHVLVARFGRHDLNSEVTCMLWYLQLCLLSRVESCSNTMILRVVTRADHTEGNSLLFVMMA